MPKGPKGEKRPADVIGAAIMAARIATGEIPDNPAATRRAESGKAGGKARAKALSPAKRREIARAGAESRWASRKGKQVD